MGETGSSGTSGGTGSSGTSGGTGSSGASGSSGTSGSSGSRGTSGVSGSSGTSGNTGASGSSGTSGSNAGITTYTNPADNRVLTSVSSTSINAESNLTFDGTNLGIGTVSPAANLQVNTSSGSAVVAISNTNSITSGSRGDYAWYNSSNSTVTLIRAAATTDNVGTGLEFHTRPVGGALTKAFDISSTGAATFSNSVEAWGNVAIKSSDGGGKILKYIGGVANYNGMIAVQENYGNTLEITASSAAGTTTFNRNIARFNLIDLSTTFASNVTVGADLKITAGSLSVGGNLTNSATDGRIDASNDIVAFSTSDRRLKENIKKIENPIEKLSKLNGVEFDWIKEHYKIHGYEGNDVGVIAQDLEDVLPQALRINDSGYYAVRYEKIIPLLIECINELSNEIKILKEK